MSVAEYKCPNCGAALRFDSQSQKMHCDSCGTDFEIDAIKEISDGEQDSFNWRNTGADPGSGQLVGAVVYSCPSCGGEILTDAQTSASSCPYCGSPAIYEKNVSGMLKPDAIIPFKLSRENATEAFNAFFSKKKLIPNAFKSEKVLEEVKGIYVPFWLFGCDATANITFRGSKTSSWSDSNYNYIKTDHYALKRSGKIAFDDVPVDGSTKADDTYMQAIEPFDYKAIKQFDMAFLSGYFADRYDVDAEKSMPIANNRIRNSTVKSFESTCLGFSLEGTEHSDIHLQSSKIRYALFPVWMLRVLYKDKEYHFAMNGQTGKFIGRLPIDWGKYFGWLISLFAALSVAGSIACYLIV